MTEFEVIPACDTKTKTFDSRSKAEDGKDTHEALCQECEKGSAEIKPVDGKATDGGTATVSPNVVDHSPGAEDEDETEPAEELPQNPSVEEDPIDWVPGHFKDKIQGVHTINRKGYCVLAAHYGVSVTAEPITLPSENEFEYAQFRAIATTEDGQEYSGFGSAHVDRDDDKHLLAELAETRALKRACAWDTGVGITAIEELRGGVQ